MDLVSHATPLTETGKARTSGDSEWSDLIDNLDAFSSMALLRMKECMRQVSYSWTLIIAVEICVSELLTIRRH